MLFSISIRCYTLLVGVFFLSLVLCFRSCFTCPASPQFHLIPLIMINRHISYHHAFPFLSIYQYFTIEYQYYSDSKHFDLNSLEQLNANDQSSTQHSGEDVLHLSGALQSVRFFSCHYINPVRRTLRTMQVEPCLFCMTVLTRSNVLCSGNNFHLVFLYD